MVNPSMLRSIPCYARSTPRAIPAFGHARKSGVCGAGSTARFLSSCTRRQKAGAMRKANVASPPTAERSVDDRSSFEHLILRRETPDSRFTSRVITQQVATPAAKPPRFRERNKISYQVAHWPIWIFVFFIAPGPLTFDLFDHGFDARIGVWLGAVLLATGIAGVARPLAGRRTKAVHPALHGGQTESTVPPVCYTAAWSDLIAFAILNLAGLIYAVATGTWRLRQIYDHAYFPLAIALWIWAHSGSCHASARRPRAKARSAAIFTGRCGPCAAAEPVLGVLWKILPRSHAADRDKLAVFAGILAVTGYFAYRGKLAAHATHRAGRMGGVGLILGPAIAPAILAGACTRGSRAAIDARDSSARPHDRRRRGGHASCRC